uniref:Uncharacterized protein n=1 Tax=Enterobacter cloacae TaxID=550 RepID=A0A1S6XXQ3_ENTCL|nr:hypothetical protein PIMI6_00130 [Enterobacter cloacae]
MGGCRFGIFYRARDHQLERTIVIKEFMPASLAARNSDLTLVQRIEHFSKTFHAGLNSFIQEVPPESAARAALLDAERHRLYVYCLLQWHHAVVAASAAPADHLRGLDPPPAAAVWRD